MTNRMDSSPRRAPDRRYALITLANDLKMPSVSVGVCARDARGIVSYIRQPVCVLQQFYVRHPSRAHTGAHTHAARRQPEARAGTGAGLAVGDSPPLSMRPVQGPSGTVLDLAEAGAPGRSEEQWQQAGS